MSYNSNQTMLAVLLVVGLVVGAGAGYMLAPKAPYEADTTDSTVAQDPIIAPAEIITVHEYKVSWVSWTALFIGIASVLYDVVQELRFQKWRTTVNNDIMRLKGRRR